MKKTNKGKATLQEIKDLFRRNGYNHFYLKPNGDLQVSSNGEFVDGVVKADKIITNQ